jgi:osmotically-inducible protein OsmY
VWPGTSADAERLTASIERAVQEETYHRIHSLTVEIGPDGVLLRGYCSSYYYKQLAQHAAMSFPGAGHLRNEIVVF